MVAIGEAASPLFHHRKRLWKDFIQTDLQCGGIGDRRKLLLPRQGFRAQGIVRKLAQRRLNLVDLLDDRLDTAQLPLVFRADDGLKNPIEHESDSEINNSRRE